MFIFLTNSAHVTPYLRIISYFLSVDVAYLEQYL